MNRAGRSLLPVLALLAMPSLVHGQTFEERVLELVNAERWDNGELPPLKGQANLRQAAFGHSQAMGVRNFFAHCDLDTGHSPGVRIANAGYSYNAAAENIAAGQATPASVVTGWMGSSGHRANILSTSYRELGVGYYDDTVDTGGIRQDQNGDCVADGTIAFALRHYWTQNFGRRDTVFPVVIAREAWQVGECTIDVYLYGSGWATQYRLSNNGSTWSAWQSFASNVLWGLSGPSGGTATVYAEIRNGAGQVRAAQDTVRLAVACSGGDLIFANGFQ